jgi:hypothetical protein
VKIPDGYAFLLHHKGRLTEEHKLVEQFEVEEQELVTCKNCKHGFLEGDNVVILQCELMHEKMRPDFWCADGERKKEKA